MSGYALGFDLSTQSLSVIVMDSDCEVVLEYSLNFDRDLPHYQTKGGAHAGENGRFTSPALMFVEALEKVFEHLKERIPLDQVRCISGSAQQHGSMYWRRGAVELLRHLNPEVGIAQQLQTAFSRQECPIWMDASTRKQCNYLETILGGPEIVAEKTGSRIYPRYTAAQIRKIYEEEPQIYQDTEHISLISSGMASLLLGEYAAEDVADAAGTGFFELQSDPPKWWDLAVEHTAPLLKDKLVSEPVYSYCPLGKIHTYFAERFGLDRKHCFIFPWSGDNPNSAAGLLLQAERDLAVSLGTSDTAFAITKQIKPRIEAHVYRSPMKPLEFIPLVCYSNGSLTREAIKDMDSMEPRTWESFTNSLLQTPPGNNGILGFYYRVPEILPSAKPCTPTFFNMDMKLVENIDYNTKVRAIVESRCLAIKIHMDRFQVKYDRVWATGGASENEEILQILADVLQAPVHRVLYYNSASLGAAYRAWHGKAYADNPSNLEDFHDFIRSKQQLSPSNISKNRKLVWQPNPEASRVYLKMFPIYEDLEKSFETH
ncbi:Xylulose kinase [Galdieria sulphuraria]|uniref:Xylulose kinase n=1 Tax=Galdieria sulphuraria TaxID=130081 RepID=M2XD08_GALSU|nr:xylulokinase [Galdieria sulphuraria]EME27832.1 xylulokinase [Galdieria sulphuraria]GJD11692.1 Xylulose kinase [Galdieria sulphuraria]|eukprot:XP_005704352.1 xylulokinase [Galdieria sulphuraria]